MKKIRRVTVSTLAAAMLMAAITDSRPAYGAKTDTATADLDVGMYSQYIWRGYELSKDSLVIQPSLNVGYKGVTFNLWGNLDTKQDASLFTSESSNWNETDMTFSYAGSYGIVEYSVGYIYYGLDASEDTQEIFAALSLDVITAPTLTVYRDMDTFPGWYITLDLSHSFNLTDKLTLDLGTKISYLAVDDATTLADPDDPDSSYHDFHDGVLSANLSYAASDRITIAPTLVYSFALGGDARDVIEAASADGDKADFLYGGISVRFSL